MKYIKDYKIFENNEDIIRLRKIIDPICIKYNIKNYTINEDGIVDVFKRVYLYDHDLDKLPLKFGKITGYFDCSRNHLTSLEGAPSSVGGVFACSDNNLRTLKGAPISVGGFDCSNNNLITLSGAPISVGGGFNCSNNNLNTFEGVTGNIGGYFYCIGNPIYHLWNLFRDVSKIELFNYYDIIRDEDTNEPKIVLDRLVAFLEDIGKDGDAYLFKQYNKKIKGYINI